MSTSFLLFAFLLIFSLSFNAAQSVLRCWRCSTDVSNGEFCNDPFNPDSITDQQRYWSYVNCTYSVGVKSVNARPVCRKLVQEVYGKRVIARACFYENIDDPSDKCEMDTTSSYVKTIYCRTCTTDGCNGAAGFAPQGLMRFALPSMALLLPLLLPLFMKLHK